MGRISYLSNLVVLINQSQGQNDVQIPYRVRAFMKNLSKCTHTAKVTVCLFKFLKSLNGNV